MKIWGFWGRETCAVVKWDSMSLTIEGLLMWLRQQQQPSWTWRSSVQLNGGSHSRNYTFNSLAFLVEHEWRCCSGDLVYLSWRCRQRRLTHDHKRCCLLQFLGFFGWTWVKMSRWRSCSLVVPLSVVPSLAPPQTVLSPFFFFFYFHFFKLKKMMSACAYIFNE